MFPRGQKPVGQGTVIGNEQKSLRILVQSSDRKKILMGSIPDQIQNRLTIRILRGTDVAGRFI